MNFQNKTNEELISELEELNKKYNSLEEQYRLAISKKKEDENRFVKEHNWLEYIIEATQTGIDIIDKEYNLHFVDNGWQKVYGDFEGRKCYDYFMGIDEPCKNCAIPKALKTKSIIISKEFLKKENRYVEVHTIPFQNEKGEWLVGEFNIDITERNKNENELIAAKDKAELNELRFRQISESIGEVFWLRNAENTVMLYINPAYETVWGRTCESLYKKPSSFIETIHKDDKESVIKAYEEYFTTGHFNHSYRILRPNGDIRWVKANSFPVKDENGNIIRHAGIAIDITEQKDNEEKILTLNKELKEQNIVLEKTKLALESSEKKFRLIAENTSDGIIVFDSDGKNTYVSPSYSEQLGYPEDEELSRDPKSVFDLLHPDDRDQIFKNIFEAISSKTNELIYSYRAKHREGYYIWREDHAKFVYDNNGNHISSYVICRNITERKRNEAELVKAKEKAEESNRLKTAFLQNLSHEIRTPLNTIVGFSERINSPKITEEKRAFFSDIITKSSFQLLSIVSDILTMSTIDAGQETINNEKVSIISILLELEEIYKQNIEGKKIEFIRKAGFNESQLETMVDKVKLTQVLSNLLSNSIKFTDSGTIEYGFEIKGEILEFFVRDTGIGIDSSKLETIFNRFVQANELIQVNYGGTGLGLPISKGLVELMQGKIWVESEIGKGSTFYFTIPYIKPIAKTTINQVINQKKHQLGRFTVLIAEDQEPNYIYLQEFLSDFDCNVLLAKNGAEAVEICKNNENVSVILMDIKMPVMDGFTAAKIIKEFRPNLPIIAQTAYATNEDVKRFSDIFDDYLTKPFYSDKLAEKLRQYLYYE